LDQTESKNVGKSGEGRRGGEEGGDPFLQFVALVP
jgi:hypothetical protein